MVNGCIGVGIKLTKRLLVGLTIAVGTIEIQNIFSRTSIDALGGGLKILF